MKTHLESVDLMVTTKKNSLPTSKPVAGRFRLSPEMDTASFVEEDAVVIIGEPKSKRVMHGRTCAVYWHPEKERYSIRIAINPKDPRAKLIAELDFETCIDFIRRRGVK